MHADLTRLKPTRCVFHEIASSVRMELSDAGRPEEIRIRGFLSSVHIRIPGRGKGRVHTAEGRGRLVKIFVDGPLIHVAIERAPLTAL